jgi:RNA polymerase sigma-70 factor (ECF subfamily)
VRWVAGSSPTIGCVLVHDDLSEDIAAARAGDDDAFARLVEATHGDVFTLALRLTGNVHDAADVVQEAYLKAYRGLPAFRGDARFTTWLYRITANCASTHLRGRQRHRHEELDHDDAETDADVPGPEAAVDNGQLRSELLAALDELPSGLRSVVILRDVYDLTHADIGAHLGISVTAAKVRLHRGRSRLRAAMERGAGATKGATPSSQHLAGATTDPMGSHSDAV